MYTNKYFGNTAVMKMEKLCLTLLTEYSQNVGIANKTFKNYWHSGFVPLCQYSETMTNCQSLESIATNFLIKTRKQFDVHEISDWQKRFRYKAGDMLLEYAKVGNITWRRAEPFRKNPLCSEHERLLDEFLVTVQDSYAPTSLKVVRQILSLYLRQLNDKNVNSLSIQEVNRVAMTLCNQTPSQTKNVLQYTKKFLAFLYSKDIIDTDLGKSLPLKSAARRVIQDSFTDDEIQLLIANIDKNSQAGKRDYAMVITALLTGLRSCDIVALKFSNIDWRNNEIKLTQQKTNHPIIIPLEATVGNAIIDYLLNGRPKIKSDHIFLTAIPPYRPLPRMQPIMTRCKERAGLTGDNFRKFGTHSLRRTFSRTLLESEVSLDIISEMLGHSNRDSSKPYLSTDEKGLKQCALSFKSNY